jgi:anti-anti-sigma factor
MLKPTVEVRLEDGVLVAEFWDCLRLDPAPVMDLRNKYEAHLRTRGRPELVIDLNGVGYAGSASLGHFVSLNRVARQQGGRLIFCNVDESVLEVFRISKLAPLFFFAPDKPAALQLAVSGPPDPGDTTPDPEAPTGPPTAPGPRESGGGGLLRGSRRRKQS